MLQQGSNSFPVNRQAMFVLALELFNQMLSYSSNLNNSILFADTTVFLCGNKGISCFTVHVLSNFSGRFGKKNRLQPRETPLVQKILLVNQVDNVKFLARVLGGECAKLSIEISSVI